MAQQSRGGDLLPFETGMESLRALTSSPLAGDYMVTHLFQGIDISTTEQLEEAYAVIEANQPTAASIIHRKIAGLYQYEALCHIEEVDPDMFFPETEEGEEIAREMCNRCPVQQQCLDYAISYEERYGFWGGKSEQERQEIIDPGST